VHRARKDLSTRLSEAGWGPADRLQRGETVPRKP
jgi:hypothetical protein